MDKPTNSNQFTFAALEGNKVAFIIQWFNDDFYKIKLTLQEKQDTFRDKVQKVNCRLHHPLCLNIYLYCAQFVLLS